MIYGSVCSGIEAATVAWHPLGWRPAFFSEIDAFPRAVLAHHYPDVPLHGDFTTIQAGQYDAIDLLVGGTPCQSFSVAGLRGGLADDRGNLALEYLRLAQRLRPRWLVWENVPGVLSSNGGRDFGAILGGMVELGYGFAYRVLDAQYFGVPQRRRRVFVVGYLGDWRPAAAVLFERHSLSGHPAPRRKAGEDVAKTLADGARSSGGYSEDDIPHVASCLNAHGGRMDGESETFIAHSLRAEGFDASEDGTGRGTPLVPVAFSCKDHGADAGDIAPTLRSMGHSGSHANAGGQVAVAFNWQGGGTQTTLGYDPDSGVAGSLHVGQTPAVAFQSSQSGVRTGEAHATLDSNNGSRRHNGVIDGMAVRRLTPRECERLQGFPEINHRVIIRVCRDFSDQQKKNALAEILNPKSPASVSTAGAGELLSTAPSAGASSSTNRPVHGEPAALNALIDLERGGVRLHSAARSLSFAANADGKDVFRLPTGIESFARLGALTHSTLEAIIRDGRAVSQPSINGSSARLNGSSIVLLSGREIEERAAGAATAIAMATRLSTSTTFDHGLSFENLDSILTTLCCCVVRAIASFIPEKTSAASSFDVSLTTSCGYTFVPYRNKPAADGPRYKALGNSMAVPVMAWIGARIDQVRAILAAERRAA